MPDPLTDLLLIALIAALAQTVNGSMGMGYGVITSSLLLGAGMAPAVVSATVHAAEVGTTTASAVTHWRLRNVDRRTAAALGGPGLVGGFAGAVLLSSLPVSAGRPLVAGILLVLGVVVLVRFATPRRAPSPTSWRLSRLVPLGGGAGFLDATGGGGWGPVTMGTLMARPPSEPRVVVGTVNASEAAVTAGATVGFLLAQGLAGFHLAEVAALTAGGMLAAPPAAWAARHVPPGALGVSVGTLLLVLNVRIIGIAIGLGVAAVATLTLVVAFASAVFIVTARRLERRRNAGEEREPPAHATSRAS